MIEGSWCCAQEDTQRCFIEAAEINPKPIQRNKTKAQRGEATCSGSHSTWRVQTPGSMPSRLASLHLLVCVEGGGQRDRSRTHSSPAGAAGETEV